ncbi:MAG: HEPN domain-containing protein [Bacteroidetes bacterium]|nr:HEPN domain-containing protein [Bacteroidota bacterium]MCL5027988.1 HEPN domain-containing protein [Bacteroidota bacterium]
MTFDNESRIELIKYRLQQAEEAVSDVELLIGNNRFRSAVNRIYYGMFYSLLAVGLANQFESSKHAQLIGWFNKNFIYAKKVDERFGKMINKAYNRRTKSDYDTYINFDKEEIEEMFAEMKEFITEIKRLLDMANYR